MERDAGTQAGISPRCSAPASPPRAQCQRVFRGGLASPAAREKEHVCIIRASTATVALWLRRPPREREGGRGFDPWPCPTQDFKIGILVAAS